MMYKIIKYISSSIRNFPSNHQHQHHHHDHDDDDNDVLERTGPAIFTKAIIETIIKYNYSPHLTTTTTTSTTSTPTTTATTTTPSTNSTTTPNKRRMSSTRGKLIHNNNYDNNDNYPHVFLPRSILNNNGQLIHLLIDSIHIKGVILPYDAFSFHSQHKSITKKYPILTKHEYQGSWKSNKKKVHHRKKKVDADRRDKYITYDN